MLKTLHTIAVLTLSVLSLISCNNSDYYTIQMDSAEHINTETDLYYLGVKVGSVESINFGNVDGKDRVFLSVILSEDNILKKGSFLAINELGYLEIFNHSNGAILTTKDTLVIKDSEQISTKLDIDHHQSSDIKKIDTNFLNNTNEVDLSPEEKSKIDSLKNKIKNLNQIIEEVNGKN